MAIVTAVLPAAGLGTRLRPLTEHVPKELLPIGRMPVIGHVLEEVSQAGIQRAKVVVSPAKDMVKAYCGDGSRWGLSCTYCVQSSMRGVGDAVLCAVRDGAQPPLLVAFADCAILRQRGTTTPPAVRRLVEAFMASDSDAAVLCEEVPWERVRHYGVLQPSVRTTDVSQPFRIHGVIEKPSREAAPSNLVVAGRWILGERVVTRLLHDAPKATGELGITESVQALLQEDGQVIAVVLGPYERRLDVGNVESYLEAQALAAVSDAEHGATVLQAIRQFCGNTAGTQV